MQSPGRFAADLKELSLNTLPDTVSLNLRLHTMDDPLTSSSPHTTLSRQVLPFRRNPRYKSNVFMSTRYKWYTLVPINLFQQFSRLCNIYFLIVGIIQLFPTVSPYDAFTGLISFSVVVLISLIKEAVEEMRRYHQDAQINKNEVIKFQKGLFTESTWGSLRVGDVVKIEKGQRVPADLLLLSVYDEDGHCMVQTAQLDGETSPKTQCAVYPSVSLKELHNTTINITEPSPDLKYFSGEMIVQDSTISLSISNLLLRETVLLSPWAIGLVLYTAQDTKIALNMRREIPKTPYLDIFINVQVVWIFLLLVSLCIVMTIFSYVSASRYSKYPVYGTPDLSITGFLMQMLTWFLLLNSFIPLSLYVSVEFARVGQILVIGSAKNLKDPDTQIGTNPRTSTLTDTLGRIQYVLSDKTGTLTKNELGLIAFYFNGNLYGINGGQNNNLVAPMAPDHVPYPLSHSPSHPGIEGFNYKLIPESLKHDSKFQTFLTTMMLCNTVNPLPDFAGHFEGASQEEEIFASFASSLGHSLIKRDKKSMTFKIDGEEITAKIIDTYQFTSERKLMSIVLSYKDKNYVFSKGADCSVIPRLANPITPEEVKLFSAFQMTGKRIMIFAYKELSDEQVSEIENGEYDQSQVESELNMLAFSIFEDSLQAEVVDSIKLLKEAGITVWMLSGDHAETAFAFALQAGLISEDSLLFKESLPEEIPKTNYSIIMTGDTIEKVFRLRNVGLYKEVLCKAESVICARCSPLQKAKVAIFLKECRVGEILAIGDGGNDSTMLKAANVGVAVIGKEGNQAVLSSDYAIPSFRILPRLLLSYGRWFQRNMMFLIYFSFYKNILLSSCHILFGLFSNFTGTSVFDSMYISLFNTIFTSPPIIMLAAFDRDISFQTAMKYPSLYKSSRKTSLRSFVKLLKWIFFAVAHASAIFFILYIELREVQLNTDGMTLDLALFSQILSWNVLLVVATTMCLHTYLWKFTTLLLYIACYFSFVLFEFFYTSFSRTFYFGAFTMIFESLRLWLLTPLALWAVMLVTICSKFISSRLWPTKKRIAQEHELVSGQRMGFWEIIVLSIKMLGRSVIKITRNDTSLPSPEVQK